jgi:hypothetical protein
MGSVLYLCFVNESVPRVSFCHIDAGYTFALLYPGRHYLPFQRYGAAVLEVLPVDDDCTVVLRRSVPVLWTM